MVEIEQVVYSHSFKISLIFPSPPSLFRSLVRFRQIKTSTTTIILIIIYNLSTKKKHK